MEKANERIMPVIIAENAGFCFGVKRAVKMAEEVLDSSLAGENIYILGEIIHNPQTVKMLEEKGAVTIEEKDLEKVHPGKLILRSHGVPLEVIEKAKKLNFSIVDTTCPFVKKAQIIAGQNSKLENQLIIIGKKEHPEVKALLSHSLYNANVIGLVEEVKKLNFKPDVKTVIIVQTTFSGNEFKKIIGEIVLLYKEIMVYNTICNATYIRRKESLSVAEKTDVNIVVGGRNSSNTRELTNYLVENGFKAYQIEGPEEIREDFFNGAGCVGITGGASTPLSVIEDVKRTVEVRFLERKFK
ncbi:4-hydroxy-3-methylbut-2-enyl diphosphate reductase [candidate division WOR-3 bacterium]|nr:4-hydroxy-3-methylbut-2-enyl diphosphate reductase [candidate division WOR-3 bacterium]